jgi:hypothetical protein
MCERQRILDETRIAREQAQTLLTTLVQAKEAVEREGGRDLYKSATGRSSLEAAIATTRRTIESFDRVVGELEGEPLAVMVKAPADARTLGPMTFAAMYAGRTA